MNRLKKLMLAWRFRRQVRESLSTLVETLSGGHGADALGGLTEEETRALCDAVRGLPSGSVVIEFGTLFGFTTRQLAAAAPEGVKIVTVDNFCWNPFGMPPRARVSSAIPGGSALSGWPVERASAGG